MRPNKFLFVIIISLFSTAIQADALHYCDSIKNDATALYTFFKNMPKGGELHYHLTGGASPEKMLSLLSKGNYCLDQTTYKITETQTPCHKIPLDGLQKNSKFYNEMLRAWSMKDFIPGKESAHDHFFSIFFKFSPIATHYAPELLVNVMKRAARQHELYMEVMTLPDSAHSASFSPIIQNTPSLAEKQKILLSDPKFRDNIQQTVTASNDLLKKARQLLACHSQSPEPACTLTMKLQYILLREQPLNRFFAQALNGFAAASQSETLNSINLVQAEDGPISLRDYHQQMTILNFLHHAYPNVHIALHAGELTSNMLHDNTIQAQDQNDHIREALFTGHAERIGHGIDIQYEHHTEEVLNAMSRASIPVEVSLTSNQKILNITGQQHPIHQYIAHHVPLVLATDDEGILRTNLSREYVHAVMQQGLHYDTIKTMNRNTLTYSFLPGKSLWLSPEKGLKISECQNLHSASCLAFIAQSHKAKLQWELESQLIQFESRYTRDT